MDENKNNVVPVSDLSEAFDSINHEHLKIKLKDLDFSESAIEMTYSFINNRQQKV